MPETLVVKSEADREKARAKIVEAIRAGKIVVYPTDTVYGLGCDGRSARAVKKIRRLKKRVARKPFSVIAPSKNWIRENCFLNAEAARAVDRLLPGPYTLVLKLKNASCVSPAANANPLSLGVRIPKHWISGAVRKAGAPVVTTSVNEAGAPPARTLAEIKRFCGGSGAAANGVALIVFEGELRGKPSRVIDFSSSRAVITR